MRESENREVHTPAIPELESQKGGREGWKEKLGRASKN